MNAPYYGSAPTKPPPTIDYYIRHYVALAWRWKWYIVLVTPIVALVWAFVVVKFAYYKPELPSKVVLQFVQSGGQGSIDQQMTSLQMSTADAFLHSRPFLTSIVEKLNLQMVVQKHSRSDIFDSVAIDKNPPSGQYSFVVEKDSYTLFYTNKNRGVDHRVVAAGKLFELTSFVFPSVYLRLTHDFITEPHSMTFFILGMKDAVDRVQWRLTTTMPNVEGRQNSLMTLSLKGADYPLVTQTVNTIADEYIAHVSDSKRNRKTGVVDVIEKQLQSAQLDLNSAEAAMRQFREANPSIGASSALGASLSEVSSLDGSVNVLSRSINDAVALQVRCTAASSVEDQLSSFYEAITFLSTRQSIAAPALQIELNDVNNEKRRVDADYSPQHPLAIENRKKITRLGSNVSKALGDVIDKMRSDVTNATSKREFISEEFRKLPSKELRYADLERKRTIAADLYSTLFAKYNANKMSEFSPSNDVIVLDRAIMPDAPGRLQTLFQMLMMGVGLAVVLGVGPAVGLDFLDKRARNEDDCKRFSQLLYLEGIPEKELKSKDKKTDSKEKLDERLVAAGFEPGVFDEMYRSLRTKILLHLQSEHMKMLVIASLNSGEGKSLTTSNLGIVMAQQKLRTLIIDGDMRRGVQHHSFVLEKSPGLSEILASPNELSSMSISTIIRQTHIPNLSLLACGMPIPNPAECMNSQKFRDLVDMLQKSYDIIILDTPPISVAVDAAILPEAFTHYVFVARAAKTNIVTLDKKIDEFPKLRSKILGIVLNGTPIDKKMHNYNYSYYRH